MPDEVAGEILSAAEKRMPGVADLSEIEWLLKNYEFVFKRARYSYEFYEGYTRDEVQELGELWCSLGAPDHEAIVQYKPNELLCLTEALLDYIRRVLGVP